jgi:hypothetical protein
MLASPQAVSAKLGACGGRLYRAGTRASR